MKTLSTSGWETVQLKNKNKVGDSYLILKVSRPLKYPFSAGQFATLLLGDSKGSFRRSYSIASDPNESDSLEFCIQLERDRRAADLFEASAPGSTFSLSPAEGSFCISDSTREIVLIGGGSGISPLKAFIHALLAAGKTGPRVFLVFGCKSSASVPFKEDIERWRRDFSARFSCVIAAESFSEENPEKSSKGDKERKGSSNFVHGNVLTALQQLPQELRVESHYYLCGPPPMVRALIQFLSSSGVSEDQIFYEKYEGSVTEV